MSKHVTKTTVKFFSLYTVSTFPTIFVAQVTCYLPTHSMQRIAPQVGNLRTLISALNQKQILVNVCFWFITEMDVLIYKHLAFIFHQSKMFQHQVTLLMVRDSPFPKSLTASRKHIMMATVCSFKSISNTCRHPPNFTVNSHIVKYKFGEVC